MSETKELTAQEIKKAILAKRTPPEPIEEARLLGVKGWLFKSSSVEFQTWREYVSSDKPEISRLERAKLAQLSFRDNSGKAVFTDEDVVILGGLPREEIDPITEAAMRINGFGKEAEEAIVKNLIKTRGVDGVHALLESMGAPCPVCTKSTNTTNSKSRE